MRFSLTSALDKSFSLLAMGKYTTYAVKIPRIVATKAAAIAWPNLLTSFKLPSAAIRPITAPSTPRVGAYRPACSSIARPSAWRSCITASSASKTSPTNSGSMPSMTIPKPVRKNGSSISCTLPSKARIPSRRAICESSMNIFSSSAFSCSDGLKKTILISLGRFFSWFILKAVNKQENVPQIIIRNAAGLFSELIGAPLMIIPTNTEIRPPNAPMTVEISKIKAPLTFLCYWRNIIYFRTYTCTYFV